MAEGIQTSNRLNEELGIAGRGMSEEKERLKFLKLLTETNLIEKPLELRTEELMRVKTKLDGVSMH